MPVRVTYSLVPVTSIASGVKQNTKFDVSIYAKDERLPATYNFGGTVKNCPRGVFAAYLRIFLPFGVLRCNGVEFNSRFENGRVYKDDGSIVLGAFCGVASGGPVRAEVARLKMESLNLYTPDNYKVQIGMNLVGLEKPKYDTLVYGMEINLARELNMPNELSYVDPAEIALQPLVVTVLGNPV